MTDGERKVAVAGAESKIEDRQIVVFVDRVVDLAPAPRAALGHGVLEQPLDLGPALLRHGVDPGASDPVVGNAVERAIRAEGDVDDNALAVHEQRQVV